MYDSNPEVDKALKILFENNITAVITYSGSNVKTYTKHD